MVAYTFNPSTYVEVEAEVEVGALLSTRWISEKSRLHDDILSQEREKKKH